MAKQTINTDRVMSAANKLRTANTNINNEFRTLQNNAKRLENDWKSSAGSAAHTTLYQLFSNSSVRSTVVQNYINMLEQQVNPGYVNSENANTKLADKFK